MFHYNSYSEMEIYKLARNISDDVWNLMIMTPLGSNYELRNQINASSGSIMDNIAEGFGRGGIKNL